MSEISFKVGDIVRLKSGGPKMTVDQVGLAAMTQIPTVWCVWFDGMKKFSDTFAPDALELVSAAPLPRETGSRILASRL